MFKLMICDISNSDMSAKDISEQLDENGAAWLKFYPKDFEKLLSDVNSAGLIAHLENYLVVDYDYTRQDFLFVTKSKSYTWNSVEVLREVVVPYTVKGANGERIKRGWDYLDDRPMRWTSLGNVIYTSDLSVLYAILLLTASNKQDKVFIDNLDYKSVGTTLERECDGQLNNDLKELLSHHVSTSESDFYLSFDKRFFMPKDLK